MGVHLSSCIIGLKVRLGLIDETDDLDIIWGPHKLDTPESASGDKPSAVTGLGTPRDGLMLSLTNGGRAIRWRPNTEI